MTFFTDECFIYRANALLEAFDRNNELRALVDYFARGIPDITWIPQVSNWTPKPIVISGDARIVKNRVERGVLREAKLTWFCLSDGWVNLNWEVFAWKIIKAWPVVVENAGRTTTPTVYELSATTLKVERRFSL